MILVKSHPKQRKPDPLQSPEALEASSPPGTSRTWRPCEPSWCISWAPLLANQPPCQCLCTWHRKKPPGCRAKIISIRGSLPNAQELQGKKPELMGSEKWPILTARRSEAWVARHHLDSKPDMKPQHSQNKCQTPQLGFVQEWGTLKIPNGLWSACTYTILYHVSHEICHRLGLFTPLFPLDIPEPKKKWTLRWWPCEEQCHHRNGDLQCQMMYLQGPRDSRDLKWTIGVSGQVWSEDVLMTITAAFSIIYCNPFYLQQAARPQGFWRPCPIFQPWKPLPLASFVFNIQ